MKELHCPTRKAYIFRTR